MSRGRIRFWEKSNMLYGYGFDKIESIEIPDYMSITINDAIEYYQIQLYFDDGARSKDWTDAQYCVFLEKSKTLFGLSMRFFNAINDSTLIAQFEAVDPLYDSAFWELFDRCKLYSKISDKVFEQLLQNEQIVPEELFVFPEIVKRYDALLRSFIMESDFGIRILIQAYEQDYKTTNKPTSKKLRLPDSLSNEDVALLVGRYVQSETPNPNDLIAIYQMKQRERFPISDQLRYLANTRYDEEIQKLADNGDLTSFPYSFKIVIDSTQKEAKAVKMDGTDVRISYSKTWLQESLDYPSILNNFIYIFEYADSRQMRCLLFSKSKNNGFFELIAQKDLRYLYPINTAFQMSERVSLAQMAIYYNFLTENGICYEQVLKWFFTEYFQKEFGCPEIRVSFPSGNETYAEKNSRLCEALDSVLKQFNAYVEYHEINHEMLSFSSKPVTFSDIHSLVGNKYLYGTGKEFEGLSQMLFFKSELVIVCGTDL